MAKRCNKCKVPEGQPHKTICDYRRYPSMYPGGAIYTDTTSYGGYDSGGSSSSSCDSGSSSSGGDAGGCG